MFSTRIRTTVNSPTQKKYLYIQRVKGEQYIRVVSDDHITKSIKYKMRMAFRDKVKDGEIFILCMLTYKCQILRNRSK